MHGNFGLDNVEGIFMLMYLDMHKCPDSPKHMVSGPGLIIDYACR